MMTIEELKARREQSFYRPAEIDALIDTAIEALTELGAVQGVVKAAEKWKESYERLPDQDNQTDRLTLWASDRLALWASIERYQRSKGKENRP